MTHIRKPKFSLIECKNKLINGEEKMKIAKCLTENAMQIAKLRQFKTMVSYGLRQIMKHAWRNMNLQYIGESLFDNQTGETTIPDSVFEEGLSQYEKEPEKFAWKLFHDLRDQGQFRLAKKEDRYDPNEKFVEKPLGNQGTVLQSSAYRNEIARVARGIQDSAVKTIFSQSDLSKLKSDIESIVSNFARLEQLYKTSDAPEEASKERVVGTDPTVNEVPRNLDKGNGKTTVPAPK